MAIRVSQARIDQIRQDYLAGMTYHDIAIKNGVSKSTISKSIADLMKENPRIDSKPGKISPEMIEKMEKMRSEGYSNNKIAKELGVDWKTVRKHIGLQPTGCRAEYGSIVAHVTDVKPEEVKIEAPKPAPVPNTSLKLKNIVYSYSGSHYEYKINTTANADVIRIIDNGINFDIPVSQFENFVLELVELYSELSSKKIVTC